MAGYSMFTLWVKETGGSEKSHNKARVPVHDNQL